MNECYVFINYEYIFNFLYNKDKINFKKIYYDKIITCKNNIFVNYKKYDYYVNEHLCSFYRLDDINIASKNFFNVLLNNRDLKPIRLVNSELFFRFDILYYNLFFILNSDIFVKEMNDVKIFTYSVDEYLCFFRLNIFFSENYYTDYFSICKKIFSNNRILENFKDHIQNKNYDNILSFFNFVTKLYDSEKNLFNKKFLLKNQLLNNRVYKKNKLKILLFFINNMIFKCDSDRINHVLTVLRLNTDTDRFFKILNSDEIKIIDNIIKINKKLSDLNKKAKKYYNKSNVFDQLKNKIDYLKNRYDHGETNMDDKNELDMEIEKFLTYYVQKYSLYHFYRNSDDNMENLLNSMLFHVLYLDRF